MDNGVLLVNHQGEIIYANTTARSIFEIEQGMHIKYRDLFFREDGSNDNMIDLVTESIFDSGKKKDKIIKYKNSEGRKKL